MRPCRVGSAARCALAFALALVGITRVAGAQDEGRRQVAVIDLSEDDRVAKLSGEIYVAINKSDVLKIPDKRGFDPYLTGILFDEDHDNLERARSDLADAQSKLAQFDNKAAEVHALAGERELAKVTPTAEVQAIYADLSLVLGLALLDQRRAQDANLALALTHRLDPVRELDPARYPPDIIAAYKRAADTKPAKVSLEVKGTGRVWIDFIERGPAPGTFDGLDVGSHVVVVTGGDRISDGQPITIKDALTIDVKDAPAPDELKVKRARLDLSRAQAKHDDVARSGAMHRLAKLLGIGDAVMISKRPDGTLQWETWKDRAPGFSAPKLYTNQKPEVLLDGIAPPRVIVDPSPDKGPIKGPVTVEKVWYQRTWVQTSAVVTVVGAIVGAVLWARRDRAQGFDMDIKPAP